MQMLEALQDCVKKHPREAKVSLCHAIVGNIDLCSFPAALLRAHAEASEVQYVCGHLEKAATWCLVSQICPEEAAAVEDCVGPRGRLGVPAAVPKRCRRAMGALDSCMEAHSSQ